MRGYLKFLNSKDVPHLIRGSLLFSSLAYFRHLEQRTGDDWIGDSSEGYATYTGTVTTTADNERHQERLRLFGINASNSSITVSNMTTVYPHCLVLCFSIGDYSQLRSAMCVNPRPNFRYDAAVRIVSARRLLSRVFYTGVIASTGQTVADLFHPPQMNLVTYENRHTDIAGSEVLRVSPFFKQPKYGSQSEVRIVLHPRDRDFPDRAVIQIARPENVFDVIETDMDVGQNPVLAVNTYDCEALPRALEELAVAMDAWWIQNRVPDLRPTTQQKIDETFHRAWEAHTEATILARAKCCEQFGREVSILYWDARLLNIDGIKYFRSLNSQHGLGEGTPRELRELAAAVRKKTAGQS